jgi:hypothetical protein
MNSSVSIDFGALQQFLKIKNENSKRYIFCIIRKKYLVITPEEIVRQLFILYLINTKHYPKNRIAVEKQLLINGLSKRFDIMILDKNFEPLILIECKAPNVPITQDVFNQVARYNMSLQTDLIIVTNGKETYCCKVNRINKEFEFLEDIPVFFKK